MKGIAIDFLIFLILVVISLFVLFIAAQNISQRIPRLFRRYWAGLNVTCEEWRDYKTINDPRTLADLIYAVYIGACEYGESNKISFRYIGEEVSLYDVESMMSEKYGSGLAINKGNCKSGWRVVDTLFINEEYPHPIKPDNNFELWAEKKTFGPYVRTYVILCKK